MSDIHTVDRGGVAPVDAGSQDRLLAILAAEEARERHIEDRRVLNARLIGRVPCPSGCTCRGERHTEPFGVAE